MYRAAALGLAAGFAALGLGSCTAGPGQGAAGGSASLPCNSSAAALPSGQQCGLTCRAELPVRVVDRSPIVTVWVNDHPADLILDTGAAATVLAPGAARRLGVTLVVPLSGEMVGVGGTQPRVIGKVQSIAFGQIRAKDYPVYIARMAKLPGRSEADGSLGDDFLHHFEVDLDFPHSVVRLYAGHPCPGALPGWPAALSTLAATYPYGSKRQVAVPVQLDDHPMTALIDSGASTIAVSRVAVADMKGASDESAGDPQGRVAGYGAAVLGTELHRFAKLSVGNETIPDVEAAIFDWHSRRFDMLLGFDYLQTHKVWISYSTGQVHIANTW